MSFKVEVHASVLMAIELYHELHSLVISLQSSEIIDRASYQEAAEKLQEWEKKLCRGCLETGDRRGDGCFLCNPSQVFLAPLEIYDAYGKVESSWRAKGYLNSNTQKETP